MNENKGIEIVPIQVPIVIERASGATYSITVSEYDTVRDIVKRCEELKDSTFGFYFGDKITIPSPAELLNKILKENEEVKPF